MDRKQLNHRVRRLAHGALKMDEDTYRQIVAAMDPGSEGHITRCDDEHANLVLLRLQALADRRPQTGSSTVVKNAKQHRQIARLMDYLGWDWKATAHFCNHQVGKRSTQSCDSKELSKIIMGMIRIIDGDIEKGRISLSSEELQEYHKYTKLHRQQI